MHHVKNIVSLDQLTPGEGGKIVYLENGKGHRIQKLLSLGLIPGRVLVLKRRVPNYLIQVGFTQIALERSIGNSIFVHKKTPKNTAVSRPVRKMSRWVFLDIYIIIFYFSSRFLSIKNFLEVTNYDKFYR